MFSVRLGSEKMVFVSGYKMLKEAVGTQAENFVDRPYTPLSDRFCSGTSGVNIFLLSRAVQGGVSHKSLTPLVCMCAGGLFMSNGQTWKRQRRFALSTMRNFGLGKSLTEQSISEEVRYLLEEIEKEKGGSNLSMP